MYQFSHICDSLDIVLQSCSIEDDRGFERIGITYPCQVLFVFYQGNYLRSMCQIVLNLIPFFQHERLKPLMFQVTTVTAMRTTAFGPFDVLLAEWTAGN